MKKYVVDNTNIYVNCILPFKSFLAMMFYGIILWRKENEEYLLLEKYKNYVRKVVNHENIHKCQMKDFCKWIPIGGTIFYIIYGLEWFVRLFINGPKKAYSNISFEKEAYDNEYNFSYIKTRKRFNMWRKEKDSSEESK